MNGQPPGKILGKYNRPFVLVSFLVLCGVALVWGRSSVVMAVLAIAAGPVSNYCQLKGKDGGATEEPPPKV